MRLLVDTQAFLWMTLEPARLSPVARRRLRDPRVEKHLSVASVWEMAIKISIGKLHLDDSLDALIQTQAIENEIPLLPVTRGHVVAVASLPFHHRDPFDRLLVCQAIAEGLSILSGDDGFDAYGVRRIW